MSIRILLFIFEFLLLIIDHVNRVPFLLGFDFDFQALRLSHRICFRFLSLLQDVIDHGIGVIRIDQFRLVALPLLICFVLFFLLNVILECLQHLRDWRGLRRNTQVSRKAILVV